MYDIRLRTKNHHKQWIVVNPQGKIVSNTAYHRGDTAFNVRQRFNKKTLSFDANVISISSPDRANNDGQYLIITRYKKRPHNRQRTQTVIYADVYIRPKHEKKEKFVGRYAGYSRFGGDAEDAKKFILSKLYADGKIRNSGDTVTYKNEYVYVQQYTFAKKRPVGAQSVW